MASRSRNRQNLSFDVLNASEDEEQEQEISISLNRSSSEPIRQHHHNGTMILEDLIVPSSPSHSDKPTRRKRKKKGSKKNRHHNNNNNNNNNVIHEDFIDGVESEFQIYRAETVVLCEAASTVTEAEAERSPRSVHRVLDVGERSQYSELRQRSVNGGAAVSADDGGGVETSEEGGDCARQENFGQVRSDEAANRTFVPKLESVESLDWRQLMAKDLCYNSLLERSPVKYFMEEIHSGNTLRNTTTLGNDKDRERIYDALFRLPWRCELLINVGFFVCLNSFLSLLTIMPARLLMTLCRILHTRWQFHTPSAAELSDFGCFIVLVCGVSLLQRTDISLIYHMIRGQGTIKLYVVYNVLEIFDRLCQNVCGDVLQTVFNSAKGLASSPPENTKHWLWRFLSDEALAIVASIAHSFVLLAQAITLSTCIVSHNNALLALLVSNNFAEIKSNVFKRFSKDNIHSMVYHDSVERFHISAFILFVLAQNILEAEGPWFGSFISNTLLVFVCEMMIDIIKHSFIAKFNEIKPIAYSEFLEALCQQTLNGQPEDGKKSLTFIPLAPACVVIRVLTPVYAAHLPYGPLPWRLLWVFILTAMTYVMLASLKVLIGMGLHKHATWYVDRCQRRKHHLHFD
ncbi:hypothetical protein Scep_022709 [Stephania cephalantha]|uniref:Protein POLLEN DEFECTIVE IN GUIDANCE 1 n=1 Tax=Stephania cephalantha TaxID=152367 RepID=A0AAP0F5Y2_9MAGN